MKCYVVSLKDSQQRRNSIENQLNQLNIDFEFFDAIDVRNGLTNELKQHIDSSQCILRGALGCALSHTFVYKKFLQTNHSTALILEDDAILPLNMKNRLTDICSFIDDKKDKPIVVQLTFSNIYLKTSVAQINKGGAHSIHKAINAIGTVGYLINQAAAQKLLNFLYPVYLQADCWGWLIEHKVVEVYAVEPPILKVYDNDSTINHDAGYNREILSSLKKQRPLMVKLRHAFWSSKVIKHLLCKVNLKQPDFEVLDFSKFDQ